jgi:hypothetical protein
MTGRTFVRIAALAAVLAASASWAGYADFVARAHRAVEDAQDAAHASTPACQKAVEQKLEISLGHMAELHQVRTPDRVRRVSTELSDVGMQAVLASCPNAVADGIREGSELLAQARAVRMRELSSSGEAEAVVGPATIAPAVMSDTDFQKMLAAVKKTKDEVAKGEAVKNALGATMVTNEQLGVLLDQMNSDFIKLEVVSSAAKRVAEPKGAAIVGHFDNEEMGRQAADALEGRAP